MWEAYRKFLAKDCADFGDEDAFIAVGDGATPRTAALFAFLTKRGQCVAIDPLLGEGAAKTAKKLARALTPLSAGGESGASNPTAPASNDFAEHNAQFFSKMLSAGAAPSARHSSKARAAAPGGELASHPWQGIQRVRVMPHRVERVRLKVRRAVVLLLHCHCSLQQVMASIECDELVGLITSPCCQWIVSQVSLQGAPPVVCYKDPCMLSAMNDVRVWSANTAHAVQVARTLAQRREVLPPSHPIPSALYHVPHQSGHSSHEGPSKEGCGGGSAAGGADGERGAAPAGQESSSGDGVREGVRERAVVSADMLEVLQMAFAENPHRSRKKDLARIAAECGGGLQVQDVRVWFRDERKRLGIAPDKEAGKQAHPSTLGHMENALRRTSMRASLAAAAESAPPAGVHSGGRAVAVGVEEFWLAAPRLQESGGTALRALADAGEKVPQLSAWARCLAQGNGGAGGGEKESVGEGDTEPKAAGQGSRAPLETYLESDWFEAAAALGVSQTLGEGVREFVTARASAATAGAGGVAREETSVWTVRGVVSACKSKLRAVPVSIYLQPDGGDAAAREGEGGARALRVLVSRKMSGLEEEGFRQHMSCFRKGDVVRVQGVPANVCVQGQAECCLLAWSVHMEDAGVRQDAVFQVAL